MSSSSSFWSSSFHLFSLFFCLFLFSRFFQLSLPFKLHFVGLFIISVFLHVKLCAKNVSFLFSIKISVFSVSFFLLRLSQTNIFFHVLFFCLLKNGFSLSLTLLFCDSSCKLCFVFLLSFFYVSKNKKSCFLMEMMENYLLYSVSVLFFLFEKTMCVRKNPFYFPLFLKLFESFSLFTLNHKKSGKKKPSFFVFVQSPF